MSAFIKVIFIVVLCVVAEIKGNQKLVLGGKRTKIKEAPFMAIYKLELQSHEVYCGASIVSKRFLVSAAHCYLGELVTRSYILAGTDKMDQGVKYNISKIITHPNYNKDTYDYDVLVIKLTKKLKFSAKVQSIQLADSNLVIKTGAIFDAFGFGKTENENFSKYLRKVKVPYIEQKKCRSMYSDASEITDRKLCAGREGKDSCQGDSGGPLVYDNVLVGVVSSGMGCGLREYPGIYTRVSAVRKFIDSVVNKM